MTVLYYNGPLGANHSGYMTSFVIACWPISNFTCTTATRSALHPGTYLLPIQLSDGRHLPMTRSLLASESSHLAVAYTCGH